MSEEYSITIEASKKETDCIIDSMSEYIYKDVYQTIDRLKFQKKQHASSDRLLVRLNVKEAKKVLSIIVQKPFCEVYELVGKINEQLQMELKVSGSDKNSDATNYRSVDRENVEQAMPSSTDNTPEKNADPMGRVLPSAMLDRLAAHKRNMEDKPSTLMSQ